MSIVCKAPKKFESSLDPTSVGDRCQAKTIGTMQIMTTSRVVALKMARSYMMEYQRTGITLSDFNHGLTYRVVNFGICFCDIRLQRIILSKETQQIDENM